MKWDVNKSAGPTVYSTVTPPPQKKKKKKKKPAPPSPPGGGQGGGGGGVWCIPPSPSPHRQVVFAVPKLEVWKWRKRRRRKKCPSEDPRFHLRGPWVKYDSATSDLVWTAKKVKKKKKKKKKYGQDLKICATFLGFYCNSMSHKSGTKRNTKKTSPRNIRVK